MDRFVNPVAVALAIVGEQPVDLSVRPGRQRGGGSHAVSLIVLASENDARPPDGAQTAEKVAVRTLLCG
jgi:hypothetical protein